jgi:hypothetical protein
MLIQEAQAVHGLPAEPRAQALDQAQSGRIARLVAKQAERTRVTQFWTGDVWKIIPILHQWRPDLLTLVIDTDPTATLMVIGADPNNNVLWDNFDLVVDQAINDPATVDDAIVERTGAIHPGDPLLRKVLTMLAHARTADDPAAAVAHIRRIISGALPRTVAPS